MIETFVKCAALMTVILMTWLLVQVIHRRMFLAEPGGGDASEGCWSCHGCSGLSDSLGCQDQSDVPAVASRDLETKSGDYTLPGS